MFDVPLYGMITLDWKTIIDVIGLALAAISLFLIFYAEWKRRPSLEVIQHKDEPTPQDMKHGYMWYHLKAKNIEPKIFNRDTALRCIARVDFLDKNSRKRLVRQIQCHWTNQPEPRDLMGRFDYTRVASCQQMDVGFREEMFDILIKFDGEKGFYVADPWVIYRWLGGSLEKTSQEFQSLKIEANECLVRVELEAINLGKRKIRYFVLRNKGTKMTDIEIFPLNTI